LVNFVYICFASLFQDIESYDLYYYPFSANVLPNKKGFNYSPQSFILKTETQTLSENLYLYMCFCRKGNFPTTITFIIQQQKIH